MNRSVTLTHDGPIAVVALEDRAGKNTFSRAFVDELEAAFAAIAASPESKVVVVHGYDNYFCCGGGKDELLGLFANVRDEARGTSLDDLLFFDLFLRCEIPVIAAMQGHAIGGGLSLGCFADVVLMAEECIYNAVFMKYGFTPGMGATCIVPHRMGASLGAEMLFTARNYYGLELKSRGAQVRVVKRAEVIPQALEIARELADKPALSLRLLKATLARGLREALPAAIAREQDMHRRSFAQPEVRDRIERLFGR